MDNVSAVDIAVRNYLYRPDGTRRCSTMDGEIIRDKQRQLVHALVDKYNNDNNLLEVYSLFLLSSSLYTLFVG